MPELCLVAVQNDEVVGHVMLSEATVGDHTALGLGPIAVDPAHQRHGIGARADARDDPSARRRPTTR